MVNTQSLLVCVIGIEELQVKVFLKCQLKGSRRSFPLRFLWVVDLHHLVKMGDPWPSSLLGGAKVHQQKLHSP